MNFFERLSPQRLFRSTPPSVPTTKIATEVVPDLIKRLPAAVDDFITVIEVPEGSSRIQLPLEGGLVAKMEFGVVEDKGKENPFITSLKKLGEALLPEEVVKEIIGVAAKLPELKDVALNYLQEGTTKPSLLKQTTRLQRLQAVVVNPTIDTFDNLAPFGVSPAIEELQATIRKRLDAEVDALLPKIATYAGQQAGEAFLKTGVKEPIGELATERAKISIPTLIELVRREINTVTFQAPAATFERANEQIFSLQERKEELETLLTNIEKIPTS